MSRLIFTVLVLIVISITSVHAQDVIYKKNGEEIKAKVQKISELEIEYKKFENLEGPSYSIAKSIVLMIIYENGTKDIFAEKEETASNPTKTNLNPKQSNSVEKVEPNKVYQIFGLGYSDLFDGGVNLLISSYSKEKYDFMIYADIAALDVGGAGISVYSQGLNAIFGATYGFNDSFYGYGGAGVYYFTSTSSSLNIDISEVYPSIGLGVGVNLKPIGMYLHVSVPDIDLDAAYLGIGISYNW